MIITGFRVMGNFANSDSVMIGYQPFYSQYYLLFNYIKDTENVFLNGNHLFF